ncbi:MAG TPA: dienelactone hydrolase family protein [Azospirillaceae bacterium]|nr:dienelactone hydrolase family protein [Azospirillaceae bacterium]
MRRLALLLALLLAPAPVLADALCPADTIAPAKVERASLQSGGRTIPVSVRLPAGGAKAPAVLLLHGRTGPTFYAQRLDGVADRLAAAGIAAVTVDYFGADVPKDPAVTREAFQGWLATLDRVVAWTAAHPRIDPARIGIAGFSLGGFLGQVQAAGDERIKALAAYAAGLSESFPADARRLPPLLLVHADMDPIVSPGDVMALEDKAKELGAPVEVKSYPVAEHIPTGDTWCDSARVLAAFFERTLIKGP